MKDGDRVTWMTLRYDRNVTKEGCFNQTKRDQVQFGGKKEVATLSIACNGKQKGRSHGGGTD